MSLPKNEQAWSKLIDDSPQILREIDSTGYIDLPAKKIKPYREARLATKFDFKEDVPDALASRNLSVLAVSNGVYRIAPTNPFLQLKHSINILDPCVFRIPKSIRTLSVAEITSESKALDVANVTGILSDVFDEESVHLVIRNREYCSSIQFRLASDSPDTRLLLYNANGVQIEVDGGYEGKRTLHLVEAKIENKRDNITIRQLLYPHLHYRAKHPSLEIRSYLMFYDPAKSEYTFYRFDTDGDSHHKVDYKNANCYRLLDHSSFDYLAELCRTPVNHYVLNLNAPFPQADRFATVYDLFMKLVRSNSKPMTFDQLFSDYDLVARQHQYYVNTLVWMNLAVETDANYYKATQRAIDIAKTKNRAETILELARIVVSNEVFNSAMRSRYENICFEDYRSHLAELLSKRCYRLQSESTIERRLQTVKSWIEFFIQELRAP